MADLKLTVDYSELVAAAKTTDQTKQAIRLLGQQFSRTGDQSAYMRAVNQIVASQKNLAVNARMSRGEIMKLANQYKQTTAFTDQLARAQMQLNVATQMSTKGLARSGVVMQQTGYQVGDFLVQVQSGTNAFVAFGQQATQLVGLLTMSLNPKIAMLGVGLSILIPALTAAAAYFMRTSDSGKTLDDTVSDLTSSTETLRGIFSNLNNEGIAEEFGGLSDAVKALETNMVALNRAAQLDALVDTLREFREAGSAGQTEGFFSGMTNALTFGLAGQTRSQIEEGAFADLGFDMARSTFMSYQDAMEAFAREGDVSGLLAEYNRFLEDAQDGTGEITTEGRVLANTMREVLLLLAQQTAEANGSAQAARDAAEAEKEREQSAREAQRQAERTAQFVAEQLASLALQERLYLEIAKYGENSLQVETERSLQARIAYENELKRQQVGQELIPTLMQQYDAMVRAREESEKTTRNIEAMNRIGTDNIVAQVNNLAVALNTTAENAARAVGGVRMLAILEAGGGGGRGDAGRQGAVPPRPGQFRVTPEIEEAYQEYLRKLRKQGGEGEGLDAVERLQQEITFRQRILNLSQEERDLQTEIFRITNALGKDRNKYSSDFIANLAQQNLAIQEQERVIEDARKQQEQLADSIANSFGDAFMSVIDGTKSAKDAFRSMAADIIKELYRVLVVQRMVNAISGALGPGGSAGGFLSSLFRRESGGSMMAGRPYLVGERGPELVIPGRSGTVKNADLTNKAMGGGDTFVVNQTINVSTGVQQTVRNEIKQLMPQIAESAKSAVVDAKRRGGSYGRSFS